VLIHALWSCPNLKIKGKELTCVIWSKMEHGTLSAMEGETIAKRVFIAPLPAGCLENKDLTHSAAIKQLLLGQIQTVLCNCSLDLFKMDKHFLSCASSRCAWVPRGYKERVLILCTSAWQKVKC